MLRSECCYGDDDFFKGGYYIVVLMHGGSNWFIYQAREYVRNPVGTRLDSLVLLMHNLGGSGNGGVVVVVVMTLWY